MNFARPTIEFLPGTIDATRGTEAAPARDVPFVWFKSRDDSTDRVARPVIRSERSICQNGLKPAHSDEGKIRFLVCPNVGFQCSRMPIPRLQRTSASRPLLPFGAVQQMVLTLTLINSNLNEGSLQQTCPDCIKIDASKILYQPKP